MVRFIFGFIVLFGLASGVAGASSLEDRLLPCEITKDVKLCEFQQRQFIDYIKGASNGDYQALRNLAFCLQAGCDGAVMPDITLSCAYRMVIWASDSDQIDSTDASNLRSACARLPEPGIAEAYLFARRVFRLTYNKPWPDDVFN